ncbi:L-threonylcarbamoyladenylate synthase [Hanstruepera marina]|uniref:L-threonylcarbamoyladenylate synthase n=1 Tax=Hanstruepera marina TaxID=2873265 RepID=UPI001CA695D5|nr:L-threonylcarbamoyladenylate synthase [Hanstruepera marina]
MDSELKKANDTLVHSGLILYPTDTVWGIGCDATNPKAVSKIYALKKREESKALICLVKDLNMLKSYVKHIPDRVIEILKNTTKPTSIIYNNPVGIAQNLIAPDNTLAIRVVNHEFCNKLLQTFNKPIVSTSANISGKPTPKSFKEIHPDILKGVDYVVNLPDEKTEAKPSSILKVEHDGSITVIRE